MREWTQKPWRPSIPGTDNDAPPGADVDTGGAGKVASDDPDATSSGRPYDWQLDDTAAISLVSYPTGDGDLPRALLRSVESGTLRDRRNLRPAIARAVGVGSRGEDASARLVPVSPLHVGRDTLRAFRSVQPLSLRARCRMAVAARWRKLARVVVPTRLTCPTCGLLIWVEHDELDPDECPGCGALWW